MAFEARYIKRSLTKLHSSHAKLQDMIKQSSTIQMKEGTANLEQQDKPKEVKAEMRGGLPHIG